MISNGLKCLKLESMLRNVLHVVATQCGLGAKGMETDVGARCPPDFNARCYGSFFSSAKEKEHTNMSTTDPALQTKAEQRNATQREGGSSVALCVIGRHSGEDRDGD